MRPAAAAGLLGLYVVATTALPLAHNAQHERAHGHAHAHVGPTPARTPRLVRPHHHGNPHHHAPPADAAATPATPGDELRPLHTPDLAHADGRVEHFGAATLAATPATLAQRPRLVVTSRPRVPGAAPPTQRNARAHPRAPPHA